MSIKPICNKCGKEIMDFGGLLFSPPYSKDFVKKWHLCKTCYRETIKNFK